MEEKQAIFNCEEKTINFKFEGEEFSVDLTQGDLADSWNTIRTVYGKEYDTNFDWDWSEEGEYDTPNFAIYPVIDGEIKTDELISIKIIEQIGTPYDYFY